MIQAWQMGQKGRRTFSWLVLLFLAGAGCGHLRAAQLARRKSSKLARQQDQSGDITRPQLLGDSANPVLRYPVASFSGWSVYSTSYGWLDISRNGIRYTVVEPARKANESFEAGSNGVSEIRIQMAYLTFRTAQKKRTLFYVSQNRWGSIHSGPGAMQLAASGAAGTSSIQQAMVNFDRILTLVKPPPPPAPVISLRAEPLTVEKGHAVTLVWTSINAASLDLEPEGGRVAAQGSTALTPRDSTTYTLSATGPGGTVTATARVIVTQPPPASPPTIVLVEPSVAGSGQTVELTSSPLIIRGVAMDNSGIPAVTINGTPAAMRPKGAQAAEFSSDPVVLQPGENKFEVTATNAAHAEAKIEFVARFTPPAPPAPAVAPAQPPVTKTNSQALDKDEILGLLKGDVPSERIAALVEERGIKFIPTETDLADIRAAGGGQVLVDALKKAGAAAKQ